MISLFVTFRYPVNDPASLEIVNTDMKREYIPDVIEAYIQDCIGRGADKRPANELDVYTITLIIDLSVERFEESIKRNDSPASVATCRLGRF